MKIKQLIYNIFLRDLIWDSLWIYMFRDCIQVFSARMSLLWRPVGMDYSTHGMLGLCTTVTAWRSMTTTSRLDCVRPGGPLTTTSGCKTFIWTAKNFRYQPVAWESCLTTSRTEYISVSQPLMAHCSMCHKIPRTICQLRCFHYQSPPRYTWQDPDMQNEYALL